MGDFILYCVASLPGILTLLTTSWLMKVFLEDGHSVKLVWVLSLAGLVISALLSYHVLGAIENRPNPDALVTQILVFDFIWFFTNFAASIVTNAIVVSVRNFCVSCGIGLLSYLAAKVVEVLSRPWQDGLSNTSVTVLFLAWIAVWCSLYQLVRHLITQSVRHPHA